jgi:phosphomannomutase
MTEPARDFLQLARAFRADDPDPQTQAELTVLLARGDQNELRARFAEPLRFGTAGLRGLLGAGDARMNRRVVAKTTAGLCAYLAQSVPRAQQRGLCIGFDGRHMSRDFAAEVAAVASGAGFVLHLFERPVPTPLLAYSVLDRAAAGGVMITASHNPAAYNGYKVYLSDGAPLIEPHDAAIAHAAAQVASVLALPRSTPNEARERGLWHGMDGLALNYLAAIQASLPPHPPVSLRIAYSALHGVGQELALAALRGAGVTDIASVAEQATPNPDFPTVAFPNPEEPGALDRVLALAAHSGADLAIANDPDADRLAVAVRDRAGELQVLSGNQLGVLLADYLLGLAPPDGHNLVVSTLVSTPMLGRIAAAHGAHCELTLTGFKWIIARGRQLQAEHGWRRILSFEEALGYCVGELVYDKDGISAAAHVVRMAAFHQARGASLWTALEALYRRHGLYESKQVSISLTGAGANERAAAALAQLRAAPPARIAGSDVSAVYDLDRGVIIRNGVSAPAPFPHSDVLGFELAAGHRIWVRPSGTEPKLKVYLDCVISLAEAEDLAHGRARAELVLEELAVGFNQLAGLS